MRGLLVLSVCAALLAWSGSAAAQPAAPDDAEARFRSGREAMKSGRFEAALADLEESYRLEPRPGTLLNLALCEDELGQLASARLHLRQFLGAVTEADDRRELALRRLSRIDERAPDVPVVPAPPPREAAPPIRIAVPVAVNAPAVPAPASAHRGAVLAPLPSAAQRRADPGLRLAGWVSGAIGVAALVGASVAAVEVLADKRAVARGCGSDGCDGQAFDATRDGKTWSAVGSTLGAVAVTGLGLGSGLLLSAGVPSSRSVALRVTVAF